MAVYEAAVPTNTKKTGSIYKCSFITLDLGLSVYGDKRHKTKLICLQYETFYSTVTLVLLLEIYPISPRMVPNQIIRETPIEDISLATG